MKEFVGITVTLTIVTLAVWGQLKISKKKRLKKSKAIPFKERLSRELSANYTNENVVIDISHKGKFLFQIIDRRMIIENHKNKFGYAICFYPEDDNQIEFNKLKNSQFFMNFKAIEHEGSPVYVADLMSDTYLTKELTTNIIQDVFSLSPREIEII